jgi:YVTN family beta-propeller protein
MRSLRRWTIVAILLAAAALAARQTGVFAIVETLAKPGKQPSGAWLITSGQLLAPWGQSMALKGRPVDLALSPSGAHLAVLNFRGVHILDTATLALLGEVPSKSTSYLGVAFRPSTSELWASETTRNGPDGLLIATLDAKGVPGAPEHVALTGHPVPVGIAFSAKGDKAYVAFSRGNTVAVFDAASRKLEREIPVGVAPFGLALSAKLNTLYVTNRAGRRPAAGDTLAPTSGSRIVSDPITGASSTGTLSAIDLATWNVKEIPTGLAPSGLNLSADQSLLVVANGHSDSVSLIDTATLKTTELKIPAWPDGTIGSQPIHAAFSADAKRLYVLSAGLNAVSVFERKGASWTSAGAIPTGWFPSGITVLPNGALRVASIKGTGNTLRPDGKYISTAYEGLVQAIPAQAAPRLAAGLREVRASNQPRYTQAGGVENLRSLGIRHVFFIIKENRTYDQVLGDIQKGNGDPSLTMFGYQVTPNHHALAEQYVLLDNFYTSSSISFDGHHWLMMAFVSDYTQRAFSASPRGYAWDMSDALTLGPRGFFWMGAPPNTTTRVYGEFCLPARWDPAKQNAEDIVGRDPRSWKDYWNAYKNGQWQTASGCSAAGVPALKSIMSPSYPVNDTTITDQIRAEEFLRELKEREAKNDLANINIVTLTADHTNGTNPNSPKPASMVADNDFALGRMVEAISKSKYWPQSLILVVEDDAQNGFDHVDGHRTVALAIGPHIRRNAVDSNHYTQVSMVRTIQEIFSIPQRTSFLANARAMHSVFTAKADLTTYKALPANLAFDDMNPPLKSLNGAQREAAVQSAAMNWSDVDDVPSAILNRILWHDAKGWNAPLPARR